MTPNTKLPEVRFHPLSLASYVVPVALVAFWQLAVTVGWWPSTLIAPPLAVVADLYRLSLNGTLMVHVEASIWRLVLGFGIGAAIGISVGSWIGLSRIAQRFLEPTISILAPIPPPAWIPLLVITLGIEEASKIWLIAIGVFFVLVTNTVSGIRGVDSRLVEVALVFDKSAWETLTGILLPGALPTILTGLRVALGLSWILLIAAELIAAQKGLGWFIWDSRNFSRPDDMIAGMLTIGFLGMMSDKIVLYIRNQCLVWQTSFEGQ